jgi:hypothetical protein
MVAVVIVVIAVIAGLALAGVLFKSAPSSSATTPANVQVDRYPAGSSYAGEYGDEPYVALAPNGTVYVAWVGWDLLSPTSGPGAGTNFTTSIWLSFSHDDGSTYSPPTRLSPASEYYAFDPSIAFLPNGTMIVAWENSSAPSGLYSVVFATLLPGASTFHLSVPVVLLDLDRPWITSSSNGSLFLTYDTLSYESGSTYWTVSYDGGETFSISKILMSAFEIDAIFAGPPGNLYAAGFTQDYNGADVPTLATFSVASVDTISGQTSVTPIATTWLPYPAGHLFENESLPGPALTLVEGNLVVVYPANNASELLCAVSNDGGNSWSAPVVLERASGVLYYMPYLTPLGSEAALVWTDTSQGSWNTYTAALNVTTGEPLSGSRLVSSQSGYPASVLNWHGGFLGAAPVSSSSITDVIVWGDGRNLPNIYGLAQIYSATVTY